MKSSVAILMAVHNGAPYLKTSVESILNQTFKDFTFLIIDDASTDNTRDVIKSYNDPRIDLVCLPKNVGQTAALNLGLRHLSSPWIARMDADDYSEATRLEEQMKAVNADGRLICVGTNAWMFKTDPRIIDRILTRPVSDFEIKRELLKRPPIIHGTLLVNRGVLLDVGAYDERYRYAADFDLYDRLLHSKSRAVNVPRPLLGIRCHDDQDSRSIEAIDEGIDICRRRLSKNHYSPSEVQTIRSALSLFFLLKARHRWRMREVNFQFVRDIRCALKASPRAFLKLCLEGIVTLGKLSRDP